MEFTQVQAWVFIIASIIGASVTILTVLIKGVKNVVVKIRLAKHELSELGPKITYGELIDILDTSEEALNQLKEAVSQIVIQNGNESGGSGETHTVLSTQVIEL